jgi:epoxyqueuosine reductase
MTAIVKEKALELGFDLVGITHATALEEGEREVFERWLQSDYAGQMRYMHRNLDKRIDPRKLLDGAKSVIVVGLNYKLPKQVTATSETNELFGRVARYAQYEDYHTFFKQLLHHLGDFLQENTGDETRYKVCVDSVPLAERAFAVRAGLGFIGKNHMLINPELGPEILLGEIITDLELESDEPVQLDCAGCDKCIKACPTGALRADGQFDARRCISYLTIEYSGQIEEELSCRIGNRLFGCDECVLSCPYQHKAPLCKNHSLKHYSDRAALGLDAVENMSEEEFVYRFSDSPFFRPAFGSEAQARRGLEVLKRNGRICLENLRHQ